VTIHQDALMYASVLHQGDVVQHVLAPNRCAYVQVARGEMALNGTALQAGDGAAISAESEIRLTSDSTAEVLLFDLAA
jgi:hypothetical protein